MVKGKARSFQYALNADGPSMTSTSLTRAAVWLPCVTTRFIFQCPALTKFIVLHTEVCYEPAHALPRLVTLCRFHSQV